MAMEGGGEAPQEPEYESDPDDSLLPSAMRRREASDDEEGEGREERTSRRGAGVGFDGDSDGQGGAPAYEEEEVEDVEEEDDLLEDEEYEGGQGYEEGKGVVEREEEEEDEEQEGGFEEEDRVRGEGENGEEKRNYGDGKEGEVEKKENEPYAVPTAGAFYMHDDRFRERRGGRHRRTLGGQKLWESRDERAWVHDRFEEMSFQDAHYNERRMYKGRYRGRGWGRGAGQGYVRRSRSHASENRPRPQNERSDRSPVYLDIVNGYNAKQTQNRALKNVRGRGPRRYEPLPNNSHKIKEMTSTHNKPSGKSQELVSGGSAGRQSSQTSNVPYEPVIPKKQVFSSSLNSASPPFYPSGSSTQDPAMVPNREAQTGNVGRNVSSPILDNNYSSSQSNALLRGKAPVEYIGQEHLVDSSHLSVSGKSVTNMQMQSSGSSSSTFGTSQSAQLKVQGRGSTSGGQLSYQENPLSDQGRRMQAPVQLPPVQQRPTQAHVQSIPRASAPQSGQYASSGTSATSNLQAQLSNSSEVEELETSNGSKAIAAGKEKSSQGGGRSPFVYNGNQFIGANGTLGLAHGDQNFPGTPALLPVMQFSGQPHGGLGVPAVGMALPGYVAQPQLGFGNSEMAWLPMLAGAAGALGASYGPYITFDGGYNSRPAGQTSSTTTTKETGTEKPANPWKNSQRSEPENDEFGQRQNKPRRYSEMNFGQ